MSNPFNGRQAVDHTNHRATVGPSGAPPHSGQLANHTAGQFVPGGQAQPSLGDVGPISRGYRPAPLERRDDDAQEQPAAK